MLITVTGNILDPNGNLPEAGGVILFTLSDWMANSFGDVVVPVTEEAALSAVDGSFSIELYSTLDALPCDRRYDVVVDATFDGQPTRRSLGSIAIGATPSTQNIKDLLDQSCVPVPTGVTMTQVRAGIWWRVRTFGLTPTVAAINQVSIKPDGSQLLAVGDSNYVYASNDGESWTQIDATTPDNGNVVGVAWNGSAWAIGATSFIFTAADAFGAWTKRQTTDARRMRHFGDVAGRFYCIQNGPAALIHSDDNWATVTTRVLPATGSNDIAWSEALALYVVVQNGGRIYTSADLVAWTSRVSNTAEAIKAIAWSDVLGVFVAVCDGGDILRSVDGITWVNIGAAALYDPAIGALWTDVCWTGEEFLAVTQTASAMAYMFASQDGISWTMRPVPNRKSLNGVFGSSDLQRFVAVGEGLFLMTLGI